MRTIVILTLAAAFATPALAGKHVNGYTRKDGTYVAPHYRSTPNNVQYDNYSTKGNSNPYTGQPGTERDTTYDYKPHKDNSRDSNPYD